jgi:hypothetical protein
MIDASGNCLIARSDKDLYLIPGWPTATLIAGATGTGKTVSLQVLAETFSAMGVPTFLADVKGDLSGIGKAGADNPKIAERVKDMKLTGMRRRHARFVSGTSMEKGVIRCAPPYRKWDPCCSAGF